MKTTATYLCITDGKEHYLRTGNACPTNIMLAFKKEKNGDYWGTSTGKILRDDEKQEIVIHDDFERLGRTANKELTRKILAQNFKGYTIKEEV